MKNIIYLLFFLLIACNSDSKKEEGSKIIEADGHAIAKKIKYQPGDPFIKTMKESEFFEISGLKDEIIETENGTILSIPKGVFLDPNGKTIEKNIQIEITDIQTIEEQILSNITSNGDKVLDNGALYINATADGLQLSINEETPIYMERKSEANLADYLFEGVRDKDGNMHWLNDQKLPSYLVPVPLVQLDFLPPNFAYHVDSLLPFGTRNSVDNAFLDSIYYALTDFETKEARILIELENNSSNYESKMDDSSESTVNVSCPVIPPIAIKTIKNQKFENTFIATKEFEERMAFIHRTKSEEILKIYLENLKNNLSYSDSLVTNLISDLKLKTAFQNFASQGLTNVKDLPEGIHLLGEFYAKKKTAIEKEINAVRKAYVDAHDKENEKAKKLVENYKKLLRKRQEYRVKKNIAPIRNLGYLGVGTIIFEPMEISIDVESDETFDRVHVYTIDPTIKSIFSWQSTDFKHFIYGFPEDVLLLYKEGIKVTALVIAYKDDFIYYDLTTLSISNKNIFKLYPKKSEKTKIDEIISRLDFKSKSFNSIKKDLMFQERIYIHKTRIKKFKKKEEFMFTLKNILSECDSNYTGE